MLFGLWNLLHLILLILVKHTNVINGVFFFREIEKLIIEMEYLPAIKT